jgi:hypothetical protein
MASKLDDACDDIRWSCEINMLQCRACKKQCEWGKFVIHEFDEYNKDLYLRKFETE